MTRLQNAIRALPPEDIRPGQCVCVLNELWELPRCMLDCALPGDTAMAQFVCLPDEDEVPMRVVEVCLPFVLAERADGQPRTLDVRRFRLARVSPKFARKVFARMKSARDGKSSSV